MQAKLKTKFWMDFNYQECADKSFANKKRETQELLGAQTRQSRC